MVAPAFGFSVGDFIAAIKLLNSIHKALSKTNGASQDYQDTIGRIESLVEILKLLQSLFSVSPDLDPEHTIWKLASTCQQHLQEFVDKQNKFWKRLGPSSQGRWGLRTGWRKVEWDISAAKDVENLWKSVRQDVDTIQLAVSLQGLMSSVSGHREEMALLRTLVLSTPQTNTGKDAEAPNQAINAAILGRSCVTQPLGHDSAEASKDQKVHCLEHFQRGRIQDNVSPKALVYVK
ncbi:MAG: hypothetical protein Q9162_007617 [Coniocarpon cinnabarinum]